jgi:hypothetical protein
MNLKSLALPSCLCLFAGYGVVNGAAIVDWNGDYVSSTQVTARNSTNATANTSAAAFSTGTSSSYALGRALNLTTALSPTSGYTAPVGKSGTFYGGIAIGRLGSTSSTTGTTTAEVVDNASSDRIRLASQETAVHQSAQGGEIFFNKTDFLNGGATVQLTLDQNATFNKIDNISLDIQSISLWTVRLAVVNAGSFYVANTALTTGTNTLNATALASTTFSTVDLASGSFRKMGGPVIGTGVASNTLNDVTSIGFIAYTGSRGGTSTSEAAELLVNGFSANAVIPEPGTAIAVLALSTFCVASRRRRVSMR